MNCKICGNKIYGYGNNGAPLVNGYVCNECNKEVLKARLELISRKELDNMIDYELTILFHPDLENNLEPALIKVNKIIEDNGGKIIKTENDGRKRLAYSIMGQDFAIYYFYEIQVPEGSPQKISQTLNITDEVLRYLMIQEDKRFSKK